MATITHFRDLRAWQKCREVRKKVSVLVRTWPREEKTMLIDQIVRSSRSVTANIAEGYGRFYERENIRFCRIARGSLYETQDHLITAYDEQYINAEVLNATIEPIEDAIKTLNGYIHYLENMGRSVTTVSEPATAYGIAEKVPVPPPTSERPLEADL